MEFKREAKRLGFLCVNECSSFCLTATVVLTTHTQNSTLVTLLYNISSLQCQWDSTVLNSGWLNEIMFFQCF